MSGGMPSRATSTAFNMPPASPVSRAIAAAPATGACQSRQAAPNITAANPIIAPTDRSMPPVTRIGVIATASSPTSTLRRVTSKKFVSVAKFGASAVNTAISSAIAPASMTPGMLRLTCTSKDDRPQSSQRPQRRRSTAKTRKGRKEYRDQQSVREPLRCRAPGIDRHRGENDRALQRALPLGGDAKERQRRADRAQQHHA